jgi:hypothetical protein
MNESSGDHEKMGHWTQEEHKRFVEALTTHGKNWQLIEESVGTRSSA